MGTSVQRCGSVGEATDRPKGKVMARIPHEFEWGEYHDPESLLRIRETRGSVEVHWSEIGMAVYHSPTQGLIGYHDIDDVAARTPTLTLHGDHGFTLGQFSEFFVFSGWLDRQLRPLTVTMGSTEITLGEVTPLGRYLFAPVHERKFDPDWDDLSSLRIWGKNAERAEPCLLSAVIFLKKELGLNFSLYPLEGFEYDFPEEEGLQKHELQVKELRAPGAIVDIEPLRLYYKGLEESDDASAVLQYYRVLEYYSILSLHSKVDALRADRGLTSKDFLKSVAGLIERDERGAILRVVSQIADIGILERAKEAGLVDEAAPQSLGNALYDFRNGLVHAKYDQRAAMVVESVFSPSSVTLAWRRILESLALSAMNTFGTRDI